MEAQLPHSTTAEAHKKEADTTPLDEQLARELHAQLNDPQNAPPLTRRRTRKAPSFYTPQVDLDSKDVPVLCCKALHPALHVTSSAGAHS